MLLIYLITNMFTYDLPTYNLHIYGQFFELLINKYKMIILAIKLLFFIFYFYYQILLSNLTIQNVHHWICQG